MQPSERWCVKHKLGLVWRVKLWNISLLCCWNLVFGFAQSLDETCYSWINILKSSSVQLFIELQSLARFISSNDFFWQRFQQHYLIQNVISSRLSIGKCWEVSYEFTTCTFKYILLFLTSSSGPKLKEWQNIYGKTKTRWIL